MYCHAIPLLAGKSSLLLTKLHILKVDNYRTPVTQKYQFMGPTVLEHLPQTQWQQVKQDYAVSPENPTDKFWIMTTL